MNLAAGTVLGPYELLSALGAGGMGEVYRARDTRLDRIVAVKVLPARLASEGMRARFDREARAISGLTHPNICALFDVGHQNGIDYLVMEYLEGETLAERMSRGPLPLAQVLRHGAEIAQALDHAHRRGITHRDLKPGNVMITSGGAKLLDFGLAKLAEPASDPSIATEALTQREPLTEEGTVVGTLPYMSPEQVEGKPIDHRSDIFSLGVMLYEMATGRRPFNGDSRAALVASILSGDPPPHPEVSPALDRVIRTALEKSPDDRWQSAHDLGRQLRWISESSGTAEAAAPARKKHLLPLVVALAGVSAAAGVLAGWLMWRAAAGDESPRRARLTLFVPPELHVGAAWEANALAISPDGRRVAFSARDDDGNFALYLRSLDTLIPRKVEGSAGGSAPFWSPDGVWLGFSASGKLWKVQPPDGTPQPICDITPPVQASWQGDTILFSDRPGGRPQVFRVSSRGGEPVAVTKLDASRREVRHAWPNLLADGRHFVYLSLIEGSLKRNAMLASLDSPAGRPIATDTSFVRIAGDRLFFVREGNLLSQQFDAEDGLIGDPVTIADHVTYFYPTAAAGFDVAADGTVVYTTNTTKEWLVTTDRRGRETRVLEKDGAFGDLAVSPDGRKAAVSVRAMNTGLMDIWIYDLARGVRDRFTSDPGVETFPVWAADGRTLIYSAGVGAPPMLVRRRLTDPQAEKISAPGVFQIPGSVSSDGSTLYYSASEPGTKRDIIRTSLDGRGPSEKVLHSEFNEVWPQISPDGRRLAFVSDATGSEEVYVLDLTTAERVRISTGSGYSPRWMSASELIYVTQDNVFTSVRPGARGWADIDAEQLFHAEHDVSQFDVLPDGSFLVAFWQRGEADAHIHLATRQ